MTAQTYNARQTAKDVNAALTKAGVKATVTDKQVRSFVRDTIDAYDDDGYTSHQYGAALHRSIVDAMVKRRTASGARGSKTEARATSASSGRRGKVKSHSPRETAARKADAAATPNPTPDA